MSIWIDSATWLQLIAATASFFAVLTAVMSGLGFALERIVVKGRVWAVPLDAGQFGHELIGNLMFLVVTAVCFAAVLGSHVVRWAEPSALAGWLTCFALMAWFQVYYYGLHRALHTRGLVRFHRWHHASRVTTPLSGQSMSWVEAAAWSVGYALLPALFSRALPISAEGWFAYMLVNVTGNIVGHANFEPVPYTRYTRAMTVLANPFLYHALHHARWNGNYTFQAAIMDRIFGTEFADWPALHERVSRGQPLRSLREGDRSPASRAG